MKLSEKGILIEFYMVDRGEEKRFGCLIPRKDLTFKDFKLLSETIIDDAIDKIEKMEQTGVIIE